jgi:ATP-dependent DNA helicase PIF1
MFSADYLDWLDIHVRQMRGTMNEPFGGIQVVVVGDFGQLGPIPGPLSMTTVHNRVQADAKSSDDPAVHLYGCEQMCTFAFQSAFWRECKFKNVTLQTNHHQKDRWFIDALDDIRIGITTSENVRHMVDECSVPLNKRQGLDIPEGIKLTHVYVENKPVHVINDKKLKDLPIHIHIPSWFAARDRVVLDKEGKRLGGETSKKYLKSGHFFGQESPVEQNIELHVGAQVMLVKRLSDTRVNGSRGVVNKFVLCAEITSIKDGDDDPIQCIIADNNASKLFCVPSCKQLKLGSEVTSGGTKWRVTSKERFPIVRFMDGKTDLVLPYLFEEHVAGYGTCQRYQIPLVLAWALTVHKLQGAELDYAIYDMARCWEYGQAYVDLSRVKDPLCLQIINFTIDTIKVNPQFKEFEKALKYNSVERFLHRRAGVWWYPILNDEDTLRTICCKNGRDGQDKTARHGVPDSNQVVKWIKKYGPPVNYSGWSPPSNQYKWRAIAMGAKISKQKERFLDYFQHKS